MMRHAVETAACLATTIEETHPLATRLHRNRNGGSWRRYSGEDIGPGKITSCPRYCSIRILSLNTRTIHVAKVEAFTDDLEPGADLNRIFDEMAGMCKEFLEAAQALDESGAVPGQDLPEDPEAFSLLISSALPIDNDAKQTLLEITSTRSRLSRLRHYVSNALSDFTRRIKTQERARGTATTNR